MHAAAHAREKANAGSRPLPNPSQTASRPVGRIREAEYVQTFNMRDLITLVVRTSCGRIGLMCELAALRPQTEHSTCVVPPTLHYCIVTRLCLLNHALMGLCGRSSQHACNGSVVVPSSRCGSCCRGLGVETIRRT